MFYLLAYDITKTQRRCRVHSLVSSFSLDGQKSVYENFLSLKTLESYLEFLKLQLELKEDRVQIFKVKSCTYLGKTPRQDLDKGVIIL